jgi:hypothetical protein
VFYEAIQKNKSFSQNIKCSFLVFFLSRFWVFFLHMAYMEYGVKKRTCKYFWGKSHKHKPQRMCVRRFFFSLPFAPGAISYSLPAVVGIELGGDSR